MIKKVLNWIFLLLLAAAAAALVAERFLPAPETPGLRVHYIDVGQADCTLLESRGEFMLIDGGNVDDGQQVLDYLRRQGVRQLQTVVCTHGHEDHAGGLLQILQTFPPQTLYAPVTAHASPYFDDLSRWAAQRGLEITVPAPGECFALGETEITVLGPVKEYEEENNDSLILKAVCGSRSFLFAADMELEAEGDLLSSGADVRSDVLRVGHHGAADATGYRFLYEVEPMYAVISVGADNPYGHPHDAVLSRLEDAGVQIFRTDLLGTIRIETDGQKLWICVEEEQT